MIPSTLQDVNLRMFRLLAALLQENRCLHRKILDVYKRQGCSRGNAATTYEIENYNKNLYQSSLFAEHLCVASEDVEIAGFTGNSSLHAAGLFNVDSGEVAYRCV